MANLFLWAPVEWFLHSDSFSSRDFEDQHNGAVPFPQGRIGEGRAKCMAQSLIDLIMVRRDS